MPSRSSPRTYADSTEGEVKIVVDNDEIPGGDRKAPQELPDGLAAMVHEGLGLDQKNALPIRLPLADQRVLFFALNGDMIFRGDPVHNQETQVVSGPRILFSWVTQT